MSAAAAAKTLVFSPSILKSPNPKTPKPSRFSSLRIQSSSSSQQTLTQTLTTTTPAKTRVKILSEALPFIQSFRGKTVVVKYGGAAMKSEALQASVIAVGEGRVHTGYCFGGSGWDGQSYNINADTAAGELAAALGAEKLLLLTDVAGILEDKDDPGSLVKEIDVGGVRRMMDDGKIAGGMIPKVSCCVKALGKGVKTASIIDGRLDHSLLLEILTDGGAGTMIIG
ncbi:putative acetylglutamate kinase [Helianthus annuus]|nr:putative acetylglutamate kinase [Helianthus annuus]